MTKRLTALAQLVALLAEAKGITRTCELAAATGYTRRAIEMAKRELGFVSGAKPVSHETAKPSSRSGTKPVSHAKPVSHETAKPVSQSKKEIPPTPPKEKTTSLPRTTLSPRQLTAREPSPSNGRAFWSNVFENPDDNSGVCFVDGQLTLVNGTRASWEAKLGADQLDLALIEIQAGLQTNSQTPLKLQVERALARMARDKIDRDARYAKASAANRPTPARRPALSRF